MEVAAIESALRHVAAGVGLSVRDEPFEQPPFDELTRRSGVCRLRGRLVVYLDARAPGYERVAVLIDALARLDLAQVAMPRVVRERIEQRAAERSARPRPRHLRRVV